MRNITSNLNEKLKSSEQTPFNNADPKMSIQVSRARTTVMDSDYWTVETIREKQNLGDISVAPRRFKAYGPPNRIYEIHVDNGIVGTAIREYPDKLKDGWKNQFSLGSGSSVAIAFDGNWERYRQFWRLVTEDKPWIFWVDDNNVLWRQLWDEGSTKAELATDVLSVKAIRAWKNVNISYSDQGIVVGYIKADGTVWYRNYCQQADYSYIWENEKQVTQFTETALTLNLFITHDYRMGFAIEDFLGQVHWLITSRNWAGMALEQHTITVRSSASVNFIPVAYHNGFTRDIITITPSITIGNLLFGRTDNGLVELINVPITRLNELEEEYQDWGFVVRIKLLYKTETQPTVTVTDAVWLSPYTVVERIEEVTEGYVYDIYIDNTLFEYGFNGAEGALTVEVTGMFNEAGYAYDTIVQDFMPINLDPTLLPSPEVEVIWNE